MSKYNSKALLLTNIENNLIKTGEVNFNTGARVRQAVEDAYDTIIPDNFTAATKVALLALTYETDFKYGDTFNVTTDEDGGLGIYSYIRDRTTGTYSWVRLNTPRYAEFFQKNTIPLMNDISTMRKGDFCTVLENNNGNKGRYVYNGNGWLEIWEDLQF